eukprot:6196410-Pleurochrysis_carterae.AAC.4
MGNINDQQQLSVVVRGPKTFATVPPCIAAATTLPRRCCTAVLCVWAPHRIGSTALDAPRISMCHATVHVPSTLSVTLLFHIVF